MLFFFFYASSTMVPVISMVPDTVPTVATKYQPFVTLAHATHLVRVGTYSEPNHPGVEPLLPLGAESSTCTSRGVAAAESRISASHKLGTSCRFRRVLA